MKQALGYSFGLLGFLMQGTALFLFPLVIFTSLSSWWLLLVFPLGMAGMIPLGIMHALLKEEPKASGPGG